ncbi:putative nucleic acid-binding Zn-ribbon protein [Bradyrhizobium sp. USDA 3397]
MVADSDSNIAWHRVQLKKNRAELKALETARFTMGEIATSKRNGQKTIAELKRKIAQSERAIADHDKRTRRPLATDLHSLSNGSWSHWDAYTQQQRKTGQRSSGRG